MEEAMSLSMKHRHRTLLPALAAVMSAGLLLGGCGQSTPTVLFVNFDVSGSQALHERQQLCGVLEEAIDQVLPSGSRVVVNSFARQTRTWFDGRIQTTQDLGPVEKELLGLPPATEPGTYPAPALARTLDRAQQVRTGQTAILFFWNGEDEEPARTAALVQELARLPQLKAVWVVGVTSKACEDLRYQVERVFGPLGDRLIISSDYELEQGLNRFRERLKEAA